MSNGSGGVSCPDCGHVAPFVTFTEGGACPGCSTPLQALMRAGRAGR